ncbi:MAG: hypothetical protein Q8P41_10800 [Pseudomonadota bacterium]|nr:hypothetical protein [Pseudomonadota bacterium]
MLLLLASSSWSTAALAFDPVDNAVGVHVSAKGFDRLGQAIAGIMPAAFPVGALSGELACDDADPTQVLTWSLAPMTLDLDIQEVALVPAAGRLDLTIYGALSSSASTLTATGDCSPLVDLAEACSVELPTVALEVHLPLGITYADGVFDATAGEVTFDLAPIGNPLDGCILADAIGTLLGTDPELITRLLEDAVAPSLADLGATIEPALEEGLGALVIDTSLSLGEGDVALALAPSSFTLDDNGLFIGLGATVAPSVVSTCVPAGVAPSGVGTWPTLDGLAPDDALTYDAAAVVNQVFADQVLYAAYQTGALCIDLSDLGGAPLDSSLFAPVFGDFWADLFPAAVPLKLAVRPFAAPTASFAEDGPPLRVNLDGLNLAAYGELDGRETRVFGVTLAGSIGLDLPLADGVLTPGIVVDDALTFVEDDHELLPEGYSDGLAAFVPTLLGSFLPELPAVTIPSWRGLGLGFIWWMPEESWLGGYAVLATDDLQPIELSGCAGGSVGCEDGGLNTGDIDIGAELGCDEAGGCGGDSGCGADGGCEGGSGCSHTPLGVRLLPFLVAFFVPVLRRRK